MPSTNAVWGIDVGQCALKAIKLRLADAGKVEAVAFDVIEHAKILSQPDADRDELISSALEKFASRNDWQGDRFVVGVPGQQTFARFCKMPPIDLKKDSKKIHDLVRYEASQQIPFDMDDVVWDYQVFTSEDSPDVEVGIFAIRKDLIRKHLGFFSDAGIAPAGVQTIPAALYNYCQFDGQTAGAGGATVIIDVGAQNTDLIIVEPHAAWTRNIPLGGNNFTEALVRAFKLSFAKAESLKRSAATSKYARQIFQAMRPIFAELVAEIQRSIGFYSSTHRDIELRKVLALGNAFRLPGLQKYLENNLTISGGVTKLEKFQNVLPTATVNAPQFTENMLSFAAAYGLALQGLELAQIRASLLPPELARVAVWKKKRPYFIATAASLLIAAGVPLAANTLDMQTLESQRTREARSATNGIIQEARGYVNRYNEAHEDTSKRETDIENLLNRQKDKQVLAQLLSLVHEAMPPINPPELADVATADELKELIEADPERCARTTRGQLLIESFEVEYKSDVEKVKLTLAGPAKPSPGGPAGGLAGAGGGRGGRGRGMTRGGGRGRMMMGPAPADPSAPKASASKKTPEAAGFVVRVQGRLLYGESQYDVDTWLEDTYLADLRELSRQPGRGFYIPPEGGQEDDAKKYTHVEAPRKYHQAAAAPQTGGRGGRSGGRSGGRGSRGAPTGGAGGGMFGGAPGGTPAADAESSVKYPDSITGEETATDWKVEFVFLVRLGEPPQPDEKDANKKTAETKRP